MSMTNTVIPGEVEGIPVDYPRFRCRTLSLRFASLRMIVRYRPL